MKRVSKSRSNSLLELLRIAMLAFLIFTHFFTNGKLLDIKIIQHLSFISVNGFAIITGMFVFRKRSLFYRNISRLLFIIIFSIIIGSLMSISNNFSLTGHIEQIFSGSAHIWYIYAILPIYLIAPLMYKWIANAKTAVILAIALPLYAIGAAAQYVLFIGGVELFYFSGVGLIFSAIWLFSLALIGYVLKRHSDISLKQKILVLLLMFIPSEAISMVLFFYTPWSKFGHGDIFLTLSAVALLLMVANCKWHSPKINALAKRMYFVYEYHWYWMALWKILFASFIVSHPHLQFYVGYIFILLFASVISIVVTEIQISVWNKYVDPVMLKGINWTKSKIIKPKLAQ